MLHDTMKILLNLCTQNKEIHLSLLKLLLRDSFHVGIDIFLHTTKNLQGLQQPFLLCGPLYHQDWSDNGCMNSQKYMHSYIKKYEVVHHINL